MPAPFHYMTKVTEAFFINNQRQVMTMANTLSLKNAFADLLYTEFGLRTWVLGNVGTKMYAVGKNDVNGMSTTC